MTTPDRVKSMLDRVVGWRRIEYHNDDHTRQLIAQKPGRHGIGIDVGWRIWAGHPDSQCWVQRMWGNSRDESTLRLLIVDLERRGEPFVLSDDVKALLEQ